jgi:hypothetical protein
MDLGELDKPSARIPRVRLGLLDGATFLLLEDVECLHVDELPNLDRRQEWEGGADHHFWLAPRLLRQEDTAGARSVIRVVAKHNPRLLLNVRCGGVLGGVGGSSRTSTSTGRTGTGTSTSSGIDIGTSSGTVSISTGIGIGTSTSTSISFGTSTSISTTSLKTHARIFQWHARSCTCALALEPIGERRA